MSEASLPYDLFISFTEADRGWVEGVLKDALAGLKWLSEEAFDGGVPRLIDFERARQQSQRVLLVLSPAAMEERFLRFLQVVLITEEIKSGEWTVIPVIVQPVKLPSWLEVLEPLDATSPERWPAVIEALQRLFRLPPPPPPPPPPCPYPGMRPFTEAESNQFFGRTQMVADMVEHLRLQPFLALIGPSGSGKSSLIYAGLIPELRRSRRFASASWRILAFRPGPEPLDRLAAVLTEHLPETASDIASALRQNPASLATYLQRLAANDPKTHTFLVIDQFEEAFAQCRDAEKRRLFLEAINQSLAARPERLLLLLTVRSDFYGHLQESLLWPQISASKLDLPPMSSSELREAIIRPAETVGVYLEPALVERLIADAANERGVLPLLQETLVQLWALIEHRRLLTLHDYEAISRDGRNGLQVALARHADAALAELSGDQQKEIARRIFIRLVEFGEQRSNTRRQQPIEALHAEADSEAAFQAVLERLIQHRLLTTSADPATGATAVDLTHEKLLEAWPQLGKWLEAFQAVEEERRSLELATTAWIANRRDASYLLTGARLRKAQQWAGQWEKELSGQEKEFLAASIAWEKKQRQRRLIGLAAVAVVALLAVYLGGRAAHREYVRRTTGTELVALAGGPAIIGTDDLKAGPDERPKRLVTILPFSIEKYEVSNRQYRNCFEYGPCQEPIDSVELFQDETRDDQPVVGVTATQSDVYCKWIGRRLPTSLEWERAARGTEGRSWPWGKDLPDPERAQLYLYEPSNEPADTLPVVSMSAGSTPEGILHLVGNASEWTVCVDDNNHQRSCYLPEGDPTPYEWRGGSYWATLERITQMIPIPADSPEPAMGIRCVDNDMLK